MTVINYIFSFLFHSRKPKMYVIKIQTTIILLCLIVLESKAQVAQPGGIKRETQIYDDNIADESSYSSGPQVAVLNSILPNNIFNNGKPFYVEKDPVSGQINFNSKKTNDLETYINDELLVDEKDKGYNTNDISPIKSNFHDYLNLPVQYTSSKFVYPLVSSSYSNLKYQGNNKNFTSNHKNYTTTEKPITINKVTERTTTRPTTINSSPSRGGFKDNQTHKPTSYTLKPRPVTSAPIKLTTTVTTPSTVNTPKPTKSSIIYSNKYDEKIKEEKPVKFFPGKDKHHPPSTYAPTTTTVTVPPTSRPLFFPEENVRPQIISTTFRPIPTTIPQFTFEEPSSTTQKSEGSMTLSEFFNSIGVENPPNHPLDSDASSIIELDLNSLNGPQVNVPPSTTFNIPKLPQVPHTYNEQNIQQQQNGHQNYYQLYPQAQEQNGQQLHFNGQPQQNEQKVQTGQQLLNAQQNQAGQNNQQIQNSQQIQVEQQIQTGQQLLNSQQHQNGQNFYDRQPQENQFNYQQYPQQQNPTIEQQYLHERPQLEQSSQTSQIQTFEHVLNKPVSNMNNIIISPDQDSASFVLGSQQAVGSSNEQNQFINAPGPQYQYGTVIHEEPYPEFKPQGFSPNKNKDDPTQQEEQSNFRFPNDRQQNPSTETPIALPQNQIVVFPPNEKMPVEFVNAELNLNLQKQPSSDNRVVFKNDAPEVIQQIPNQRPPQFRPNGSRPPPPPQFALNQLMQKPGGPNRLPNILPQFRPNAKTSYGHPPYNKDVGVIRLPNGQFVRPPPPPPHFRQQGPDMPPPPPMKSRPNLNQDPNRFVNKMSPAMGDQPIRRYYRIPPPPMRGPPPMIDRIYTPPSFHKIGHGSVNQGQFHRQYPPSYGPPHGPPPAYGPEGPQQLRTPYNDYQNIHQRDEFPINPQFNSNINTNFKTDQLPPQYPSEDFYKQPPTLPEQRNPLSEPQFVEEPLATPLQPEPPKLEQVVTLQMIQSKKAAQDQTGDSQDPSNPLYVVYPVKSLQSNMNTLTSLDIEDPVVVGQRGEHPPLPPSEIDQKSDFQNTPFQIVRNEQEPILMAKDKPIKMHFPYNLVKPDPLTIAELDRQSHIKKGQLNDFDAFNTGEAPIDSIPKVINRGQDLHLDDFEEDVDDIYSKETRRPIAIAYTPTQPPQYPNHKPDYTTNHQPEYENDDEDIRGEHYEQDFQAPFFPSVSLGGTVVKNEYEGWNVITPTTTTTSSSSSQTSKTQKPISSLLINTKHEINRSDTINQSQTEASPSTLKYESTTKKFNPDTFQPEYETGFRPIIPNISNLTPQKLVHVTQPPSTISATTQQPRTQSAYTSQQESRITAPETTPESASSYITPPIETTFTTQKPTTSFFYSSSKLSTPATPITSPKSISSATITPTPISTIETTSEKSFFESLFDLNLDDDYEDNKARSS